MNDIPQSDQVRLARPPAPIGNGTTVGAQPVARSILPDIPECLRRWWPSRYAGMADRIASDLKRHVRLNWDECKQSMYDQDRSGTA